MLIPRMSGGRFQTESEGLLAITHFQWSVHAEAWLGWGRSSVVACAVPCSSCVAWSSALPYRSRAASGSRIVGTAAGDVGVAIAEWARHYAYAGDRAPGLDQQTVKRTVYRLNITLDRVLDLRAPQTWADLMLGNAPHRFLDREIARATAQFIRRTSQAQGLLVPTVAMLHKPERWNLVLCLEKLPADTVRFITAVQPEGPFRWR